MSDDVSLSNDVVADTDVMVPMRDGVRVRTDIYRPAAPDTYPVLLMRTPYAGDGSHDLGIKLARRGYVHVMQHCRGRCGSEGVYVPHVSDIDDGYDAVEWAAAQQWSNGRVGMIGASHPGLTQWSAAIARPPHLRAIAPVSSPWRVFGSLWLYYSPGVLSVGMALTWTMSMLRDEVRRRGAAHPFPRLEALQQDAPGPSDRDSLSFYMQRLVEEYFAILDYRPLRDLPSLAEFAPWWPEWCDHVDPSDGYWRAVQAADHRENLSLPILHVTGWYDAHPNATTEAYAALAGTAGAGAQRMIIGPWAHAGPTPRHEITPGSLLDFDEDSTLMRFLDEHVKGVERGLSNRGPIELYVMGDDRWREEWEWPLARTEWTPLYLRTGGRLSSEPPAVGEPADLYFYDPSDPVPARNTLTFRVGDSFDQREIEARADVLVYTTPALERDVEVTGPVAVELWACSSAPDTDFTAKLVDVLPNGCALPVCQGITRASYRAPDAAPLNPHEVERFEIALWPTSTVFKAGHCIRLEISSSEWPTWEINPNTGKRITHDTATQLARQNVFHDPEHQSHVLLPIIPR